MSDLKKQPAIVLMPVAEVRPLTADEWFAEWRKEADARNALRQEFNEQKQQHKRDVAELNQRLIEQTQASIKTDAARLAEIQALRSCFAEASHNAGPAFVMHEEHKALQAENTRLREAIRAMKHL